MRNSGLEAIKPFVFPFNVAAYAGVLILGDGFSGGEGFECGAEVAAGDGDVVAGAAGVELATVDEGAGGIEEEEIGGAGGVVVAGDLLGLVVEIGEDEAEFEGLLSEGGGGVVGIIFGVVGTDGGDADAGVPEIDGELGELLFDVFDEGAMAADEHDEQAFGAGERCGGMGGVVANIFEGECGRSGAEREHGGFSTCHVGGPPAEIE